MNQDQAIQQYQHEKSRSREADALLMLRKIASVVKPIMRQRRWRVGVLAEFYPHESNLLGLNINKGSKICLRLRYATDDRQFLPIEDVTDTMLHELCHIVHGPHDEHFHNLWNQLRDEHESLIRKGYTGEGFLSVGRQLGGTSHRIPMHEARRRARAAAESRQKSSIVNAGQRLGGMPVQRGKDIRQVIADAATRRITITQGCASGSQSEADRHRQREIVASADRNGVKTNASQLLEEDENEEAIMIAYIDLVQEEERQKYGEAYHPASQDNPAGSRGYLPGKKKAEDIATRELQQWKKVQDVGDQAQRSELTGNPASTTGRPLQSMSTSRSTIDLTNPHLAAPSPQSWTCTVCTLVNPPNFLLCDACGIERPSPPTTPLPDFSSDSTKDPKTTTDLPGRDKSAIRAIQKLRELDEIQRKKPARPLAWSCPKCGQFTEQEWWTCPNCGAMKTSS